MTQRPSSPMDLALWTGVDDYLESSFGLRDPIGEAIIAASRRAGLPPIEVSPPQGRFLEILSGVIRPTRVLEIGTLGGYSASWLARGLAPGGNLFTIEREPHHARVARENIGLAGVDAAVEVIEGPALEVLPTLVDRAPFDLLFLDADKADLPDYLDWAVRLSRTGSAIVVDNVIRRGDIADATTKDASVLGVRKMNERIRTNPRLRATALQTVGRKGHDGFTLILVGAPSASR